MEQERGTREPAEVYRPKKSRWSKRAQRWLMLNVVPPVMSRWMWWFDRTALADDEKDLVLINHECLMERVRSRQNPSIIAIWHNRLIFGPTAYSYLKGRGAAVMVSRSFDGEVISRTLKYFPAFTPVRGGSASKPGQDKGGQEALAEMIEFGKQGFDLVITPDGPQGPVYQAKRGVVELGRATGFPIFGVGCNCSRYLEAKSWDKTRVPTPYAHFIYRVGEPIIVPPDADDALLEEKRKEVEQSLRELTDFVDHFYKKT